MADWTDGRFRPAYEVLVRHADGIDRVGVYAARADADAQADALRTIRAARGADPAAVSVRVSDTIDARLARLPVSL